ncbi:uncharacterized protein BP5553_02465 [Venustampulla echinocandica]|uniref:Uncharacterized protein n=1 Tax=Venustampulla echinocandica TaxID=2656787 RepID=A0A370U3Y5_9HELO|nr:uncharacterized protein BP5553_02465 [Venustampulla echinocandica]RDL42486.1 hypothetical protein BP5553_02465 [Venustampulla echinocandica]
MAEDFQKLTREGDLTDDSDAEEDSSAGELPFFDIGLSREGNEGGHFRVENLDGEKQRENWVERKGLVDIRCTCLDVIHGLVSPSGTKFATLVVLKFRFSKRKNARRIKEVNIKLEFQSTEKGVSGPEVAAIAPFETMSLVQTTEKEEEKKNASVQLGGAAPVGGLTASASLGWEKTVSRDTSDETTVTGSVDLAKGVNRGKSTCASWTLLENSTKHTGVPESMTTAILLKRDNEELFQCVIHIDAEVDFKSSFERIFGGKGRVPKDDPVYFDPALDSTNLLREYKELELGGFELQSVCDVTFRSYWDAIKDHTKK